MYCPCATCGTIVDAQPGWRNGIRGRLKPVWPQGRRGSTPLPGTTINHQKCAPNATTQRLGTIAIAAIAYAAAESVGGNGFVAAFVAGLTIGTTARSLLETTSIFAETEGQLLTLLTFLFFGAVVAGDVLSELSWRTAAYAALSLLVVRPLATALALIGSRLSWSSVAFIGWAGPRGLASIVYAVIIVEAGQISGADEVFSVAAWTIIFSILLHGLSAAPLSRRYGAYVDTVLPTDAPERQEVSELPVRLPPRRGKKAEEQA